MDTNRLITGYLAAMGVSHTAPIPLPDEEQRLKRKFASVFSSVVLLVSNTFTLTIGNM